MLKQFYDLNHYKFAEKAFDWKEAIRLSCEPLEKDGTVEKNYKEDIIKCIEKYGPYIIIMPMIAIPHSQEFAEGVHKTAISFMKLEEPVCFDEGDKAQIFFTIASCNTDEHLKNMQLLTDILINEDLIEDLKKIKKPEQLLELQDKYFS